MSTFGYEPDARLDIIERELARPLSRLSLTGKLEEKWRQFSNPERMRGIFLWNFLLVPTNILLLLADLSAGTLRHALFVRLGFIVPIAAISLLILKKSHGFLNFISGIAPYLVVIAGVSVIMTYATPVESGRYEMALEVGLLFIALIVPYRFREILVIACGGFLINAAILLLFDDHPVAMLEQLLFNLIIVAFSLAFAFKRGRDSRNKFLIALRDEIKTQELIDLTRVLMSLSETDELTDLKNRRHLLSTMSKMRMEAAKAEQWLSVIMIDVDNFKSYNDAAGHDAGDTCLKHIANALACNVTSERQYVARYGGEEFSAIVIADEQGAGAAFAESIRASVEALAIPHPAEPAGTPVTVSVGYAEIQANSKTTSSTSKALFLAADRALYEAKAAGRNCIRRHDFEHPKGRITPGRAGLRKAG